MIPARAVCSPVPVTSTRIDPVAFTVPAITLSPGFLSTGRDSPVIIASFTALLPSRTTPSAGMLAPGRTRTVSPCLSSLTGTSSIFSPVTRVAVSGTSFANSPSAPCACMIDRISIQWPRIMMVMSVASSHQRSIPGTPRVTATLNVNATVMASEMSVIIPGRRSLIS